MVLTDEGWRQLWRAVAERLAVERAAGRGHLLTEDVVRYQTVLAFGDLGVAPGRLVAEYLSPHLRGGKIDLIVDPPSGAAIEFKFPRDSPTGTSADTMTLGELLKDVIRIPRLAAEAAWIVQVLNPRLARYLRDACTRLTLAWPFTGEQAILTGEVLAGLPLTAARALGRYTLPGTVRLECRAVHVVDDALALYAHHVTTEPAPMTPMPRDHVPPVVAPAVPPHRR